MAEYTQTTTFANGNTADGGEVNTEVAALGSSVNNIVNAQVDSSADIAMTKLADFLVWADYNPVIRGGTVGGAGTYTAQDGRYCQIGKIIFFVGSIGLSAHTGSGEMRIDLPTGVIVTSINMPFQTIFSNRTLTSGDYYFGFAQPTLDYFVVKQMANNSTATTPSLETDAVFTIYFSGFYEIA